MAKWTIGYDATVTVNVEAETEKEAIEAADKKAEGMSSDNLSVGQLYVVTNDDNGETVLK